MTTLFQTRTLPALILLSMVAAACGSGVSPTRQVPVGPTAPTGPAGSAPSRSRHLRQSPLSTASSSATLRPTLTVQNVTSSAAGTRTYEFQVSDNTDFSLGSSLTTSFLVSVNQTGVAEGGDGRTSFTVSQDLQPTTRMYLARASRSGHVHVVMVGTGDVPDEAGGVHQARRVVRPADSLAKASARSSAPTRGFPAKGSGSTRKLRTCGTSSAEAMTNGEFSVEVEGLHPNGPNHKLKIFSMNDSDADPSFSDNYMSTMYRGIDGNPPNCIAFKAVFGSQSRIAEPNSSAA